LAIEPAQSFGLLAPVRAYNRKGLVMHPVLRRQVQAGQAPSHPFFTKSQVNFNQSPCKFMNAALFNCDDIVQSFFETM